MAQLFADIKSSGPPTKDTPGAVGQFYVDRDTGIRYECTEAFTKTGYKFSKTIYTWEERGIDMDFMATDDEVAGAINDLREEIGTSEVPAGGYPIWAELVD